MTGPMPRGHWTSHSQPAPWGMLHPGRQYEVVRAFRDYDGFEHVAGERWFFLGFGFLPYDDGLSLFVSLDDDREWHIRMQLRPEEQGPIIDRFEEYVAEVKTAAPPPPPLPSSARKSRAPEYLLAFAFCVVLLSFVLLHQSSRSPSFVVPGAASLGFGFAGVVGLGLGFAAGFIAIVWITIRAVRSR